jgi:methanogenic corrinoid protein MtbC1
MASLESIIRAYDEAVFDTDRDRAMEVGRQAVAAGVSPEDMVFKVIVPSIEKMMSALGGDLDVSLAQHFMTAQIASQLTEEMLQRFSAPPKVVGRVVIGTARGDLHSLGKRIVMGCLRTLMIEAIDLGVNVPAERFVDEAVAHGAGVIAISAMMAHTARSEEGSRGVRRILSERGLEGTIRIAVGGAPFRFDPGLYREVGADAWAPDGIKAGRAIGDLLRNTPP